MGRSVESRIKCQSELDGREALAFSYVVGRFWLSQTLVAMMGNVTVGSSLHLSVLGFLLVPHLTQESMEVLNRTLRYMTLRRLARHFWVTSKGLCNCSVVFVECYTLFLVNVPGQTQTQTVCGFRWKWCAQFTFHQPEVWSVWLVSAKSLSQLHLSTKLMKHLHRVSS